MIELYRKNYQEIVEMTDWLTEHGLSESEDYTWHLFADYASSVLIFHISFVNKQHETMFGLVWQ